MKKKKVNGTQHVSTIDFFLFFIGFQTYGQAQDIDETKQKYIQFIIHELKKSEKIPMEIQELLQPIDEEIMTKDLLQLWDHVTSLSLNEQKNKRAMEVLTYRYIAFLAINRRTPDDKEDDSSIINYRLDKYQVRLAKLLVTAVTSDVILVP